MRQDDRAAADRRIRQADVGAHPRRRQGHHGRAAQPPRHRDGLPGVQPLPEHDRGAQRRVRPARAQGGTGRETRSGAGAARARRARPGRRPVPASALGRHAAARRARPGARDRAASAPARRAALGARRQGPRPAPGGDPAHPDTPRDHDDLRHARPGGGPLDLGSRGGALARADRADRLPRRDLRRTRRRRSSPSSSAR